MVETGNPQQIFDINAAGTMIVLEMTRRMRAYRLVMCSTLMVYGPDAATVPDHAEASQLS